MSVNVSNGRNDKEQDNEIQPYPDAQSAREEVREFSRPKAEVYEIKRIKERLMATGPEFTLNILRLLLDNFENFIQEGQKATFELTEFALRGCDDVTRIIQPLSLLVGSRDMEIRKQATDLICSVGAQAKPAEDLAMGCLRNNDPDIRLSGARILYAIGTSCSRSITRQLRAVAQRYINEREFCALLLGTIKRIASATNPPASGSSSAVSERSRVSDSLSRLLEGKTVLVTDDNDGLRSSICEMLTAHFKMRVLEAEDGSRGIAAIDKCRAEGTRLDYVVLDLKMPEVNGVRVLQHMRAHPETAEVPVVVVSAVTDERIRSSLDALRIAAFIQKPFRVNQLIKEFVACHPQVNT